MNARLVVLVSGAGTNLQALLDACADPGYGATVVAVGADRDSITALDRAEDADVPTFTLKIKDFATRDDWDQALAAACAQHQPDLIVLAGFMKLVG
jgi:phosphoribosylglycinamide formyltransferase-1